MNAPLNILAALASYGVKALIENGRVRLVCLNGDPPPTELIEAARARKEELRALLTDDEARRDAVEVRAAFPEFEASAKAEAIAGAELAGDTQGGAGGAEDDTDLHDGDGVLLRLGFYSQALAALRADCPAYVDAADWHQAIEDVHRFVTQWGKKAEALGWPPGDLFGLHTLPEKPAPNYRRLSRYDQTGLIWLLHGRPVIALTENEATILAPSGANLTYGRHNKTAPARLGDSVDDISGARA
jgi:hypothetical protein